jgi:hypothetical protein
MDLYSDVDLPHAPTDHPNWQESWVLAFRDPATNLIGFLRVGAYVNEGLAQMHWGVALPDGLRFRRHLLDLPLKPEYRTAQTASAGPMTYSIPNGEYVRFEGHDPDCDVDLRLYDYFPSQNWRKVGDIGSLAANHPESSGRLEGRVRIGDRVIDIQNGFGHRDHSWGPREHIVIRNNRWIAGTVGPALSFSLSTVQFDNGEYFKGYWLVRAGKSETVKDINTVAMVLADGVSAIGGWTDVLLESGERIRIEAETIDGIVTSSHLPNGGPGSTPAGVEAISIARWNGHEGFCDFNINVNGLGGEKAVTKLMLANHTMGLSQRPPIDLSWARPRRGA